MILYDLESWLKNSHVDSVTFDIFIFGMIFADNQGYLFSGASEQGSLVALSYSFMNVMNLNKFADESLGKACNAKTGVNKKQNGHQTCLHKYMTTEKSCLNVQRIKWNRQPYTAFTVPLGQKSSSTSLKSSTISVLW